MNDNDRISEWQGGQTGADRAGLEAAQEVGIETGGTAPFGWLTDSGPDPSLRHFGLQQHKSASYPDRTKQNVDDSDGTIVFRFHSSPGTDKTIGYAQTKTWISKSTSNDRGHRPVLVIADFQTPISVPLSFIKRHRINVLNIAGHRESKGIPDFGNQVKTYLVRVFQALDSTSLNE